MSVFRVERTRDYTVMSNHHLRNKALSLKAKGLLSLMLSLPDDWDYTLQGLARISIERIDAVRCAVKELENEGYITRSRERDKQGRLRGTEYIIREQPVLEKPTLENPTLDNPTLEKPMLENPMQLNIKEENTNETNTYSFNSQSVSNGDLSYNCRTDERKELDAILDRIDWSIFKKPVKEMFSQAIERMYYTKTLKIGNAVLPNKTVRDYLGKINEDILISVLESMKQNSRRIVNPIGYLTSMLINAVCEQESDNILSLPPDCISASDFYEPPDEGG